MIPCIGSLHVSAEHPVDRSALPKAQKLITMQYHSARTRTAEVFGSCHHLAHFGRAQAVLRSGTAAGKVTVTVSCEGCEDETIDIVVEYKRNTPQSISARIRNKMDPGWLCMIDSSFYLNRTMLIGGKKLYFQLAVLP